MRGSVVVAGMVGLLGAIALGMGEPMWGQGAAPIPPDAVEIVPANLAIASSRGAVETRTLLIQSATPLDEIQVIPLDLNHADGLAVLPRAVIQPNLSNPRPSESFLSLPITFDFGLALRSGEFSGQLLVSYRQGEERQVRMIPLTVRIKDRWFVPLLVMVVGVLLGTRVSIYRTQGRPRDEILVRMGQLRSQMRGDGDLSQAPAFLRDLETHLIDADIALQAERWEEARTAIAQAETVWGNWRKGRLDWLAQGAYHDELADRIMQEPTMEASPYLKTLYQRVDEIMDTAANADPAAVHNQLDRCRQQMNQFLQLQAHLERFQQLVEELPILEQGGWRSQLEHLTQQLHTLHPEDELPRQTLQQTLENAIAQLEQLVKQQGGQPPPIATPNLMIAAPALRTFSTVTAWSGRSINQRARLRLQIFSAGSYAIAVILLAGVGFLELYVNNPTFGATPWTDYFSLLAWGFGAEATRDSVTKVLQGWVPGMASR